MIPHDYEQHAVLSHDGLEYSVRLGDWHLEDGPYIVGIDDIVCWPFDGKQGYSLAGFGDHEQSIIDWIYTVEDLVAQIDNAIHEEAR